MGRVSRLMRRTGMGVGHTLIPLYGANWLLIPRQCPIFIFSHNLHLIFTFGQLAAQVVRLQVFGIGERY